MAAMEGDGQGTGLEEFVAADELSRLVRKYEGGHRLARPRRVLAYAMLFEPCHEPFDRDLKCGPQPGYRIGKA